MSKNLEIKCQSSHNIHLEINFDLKNGFLRIVFWRFMDVKRTILSEKNYFDIILVLSSRI
jgi:hypothetical protein